MLVWSECVVGVVGWARRVYVGRMLTKWGCSEWVCIQQMLQGVAVSLRTTEAVRLWV